jgi:hypothetical protein
MGEIHSPPALQKQGRAISTGSRDRLAVSMSSLSLRFETNPDQISTYR